jgi:hypothetical protein
VTFANTYYQLLLSETWIPDRNAKGNVQVPCPVCPACAGRRMHGRPRGLPCRPCACVAVAWLPTPSRARPLPGWLWGGCCCCCALGCLPAPASAVACDTSFACVVVFLPAQYNDPKKEIMMLPADLALRTDPAFRKWVEVRVPLGFARGKCPRVCVCVTAPPCAVCRVCEGVCVSLHAVSFACLLASAISATARSWWMRTRLCAALVFEICWTVGATSVTCTSLPLLPRSNLTPPYRHIHARTSMLFFQLYAKDNDRFFTDFAAAYSKLLHLGVPKAKDTGFLAWLTSFCR